MRNLAYVALSLLFVAPLAGAGGGSPEPPAVALVCRIEGSATLRPAPGAPPEALAPGRRLAAGDVLEAGPRSAITVVFFDGQHLVLLAGARATVRAEGLHAAAEGVRRLARMPFVVDLAPVLREGAPRIRTPAVPIRGGGADSRVSGLTPNAGAKVRRSAAVLSFTPVPEVTAYRLTVTAGDGSTVFTDEDLRTPRVQVPAERLRPGTRYSWWVEPRVPPHPEMRADSAFTTWNEKVERAREALAAGAAGDPDLGPLLAEVDR